ncbi:E3 ubiquitin-protein ligase ZSWIM2 [Struthio camelus]|uniref:E3 ubiquitin-protein ligase ZSWIM2 n=1 Tax=Struthio camelus TaxID=8801 RepID=UPI003603FDCC
MPRRRRGGSAALRRQQDRALSSTMRVVRELGPTAFLLQEDGQDGAPLRVCLGEPHSCTCSTFLREKALCKHICWILLKKYRLPRDHEYALKLGLLEREIEDMLQRLQHQQTLNPGQTLFSQTLKEENDRCIHQKKIGVEDVCPICQEELLKKMLPITYCRYSCGNNVHIKCMKIWADHQDDLGADSVVKCPLCREEFAPLKLILEEFRNSSQLVTATEKARLDRHLGIPCNNCRAFPIVGRCYKCTECIEYHLCHECFTGFCHSPHVFVFRQKRNKRWRSLEQLSELSAHGRKLKSFNPGNNSKEAALHLQEKTSCTPKGIVKSLPSVLVRKHSHLLAPGIQCRHCLKPFHLGQHVRLLPCNHKFHRECIDNWLLQQRNTCPIDEYVVYNPLIWKDMAAKHGICPTGSHRNVSKLAEQVEPEIFISGKGLLLKQTLSGHASESSQSGFKKPYNKDVADSLSSFETSFCKKSNTIRSRKNDIRNAGRSQYQFECSNMDEVVPFKKDMDCDNCTILRYPRELNFEIKLGAASHPSKRASKDVGNASHQSRLLTRRPPKHHNLNIKTAKTDLLLEAIPLHTSS